MSALPFAAIDISAGQAGLGLIVLFCIAAIWAAADHPEQDNNNKER